MPKSLKTILTLRVDDDLARAVRNAAQRDGASTSQFLRRLAAAAIVREHAE